MDPTTDEATSSVANETEDAISCGAESDDLTVTPTQPPLSSIEFVSVSVTFREGSLGLVLKKKDGVILIEDIQDGTQACQLDIQRGDELWSCGGQNAEGPAMIQIGGGGEKITKGRWEELVSFMRDTRPLTCQLMRATTSTATKGGKKMPTDSSTSEESAEVEALSLLAQTMVWKAPQAASGALGFLRPKIPPSIDSCGENGSPTHLANIAVGNGSAQNSVAGFLVKPGRRLVKEGDLEVRVKGNLWSTTQVRRFFLFNNLLLITIPNPNPNQLPKLFTVETVVELVSAKVYSHGEGFGKAPPTSAMNSSSGFEIHHCGGIVQVLASNEERETWVLTMYLLICELYTAETKACGWRHQILLGTMHSAVIRGDVQRVKDLLRAAEIGDLDYSAVESPDEDGFTPLHYACILRQFDIVALLHGANADVTIGDNEGKSPIHWASLQLDNLSLGLLVANVFDADLVDKHDRTPLFLACAEGRDVMGRVNGLLLLSVLKTLLGAGANPDGLVVASSYTPHQFLASSNDCHEALDLLLEAGASVNHLHNGQSALHLAATAKSIKPSQGEGVLYLNKYSGESLPGESTGGSKIGCLRSLLKHGAMPNLLNNEGKAPLHLIADNIENWGEQSCREAVSLLIAYGARMDETKQCALLRSKCQDKINIDALEERWANLGPCNADALNFGVNSLASTKEAPSSSQTPPLCQLCCSAFTLFRRQHHCRLCSALTCDECSKRRATVGGTAVRCCDACFNRVLYKCERQQPLPKAAQAKSLTTASLVNVVRPISPPPPPQLQQRHATTSHDKEELLAGAPSPPTTKMIPKRGGGDVEHTKTVLKEAGDRLKERGEILSKLGEKSNQLSEQSSEFHRLAKQLNEQRSSFW